MAEGDRAAGAEGGRAAGGELAGGPLYEARPDDIAEVHRHALAACSSWGLEHLTTSHSLRGRLDGVVFSSGGEASALIALQATLGEGPSPTAVARRTPVLVPDLADDHFTSPWVLFCAEALARGVRSVVALPLLAGPLDLGVATLHGSRPVVARQLQGRWRVAWSSSSQGSAG